MSSLMLFGFVRHRARPPNVGMIVGSERRNAKHIMMSMGFGGSRLSQFSNAYGIASRSKDSNTNAQWLPDHRDCIHLAPG
jgi:hypothetical protein